MPYVETHRRRLLDLGNDPRTPGELNYVITRIVAEYLGMNARYSSFNEAIGVLECAKQELYRRVVSPYEDRKLSENGDVYTNASNPPV